MQGITKQLQLPSANLDFFRVDLLLRFRLSVNIPIE
jgi:hypothetical protein